MNGKILRIICGTALFLVAACAPPDGETAEATTAAAETAPDPASDMTTVERAVVTARVIRAMPHASDSIFTAHGLTRADFDSLMYDIAADRALSQAYIDAMNLTDGTP